MLCIKRGCGRRSTLYLKYENVICPMCDEHMGVVLEANSSLIVKSMPKRGKKHGRPNR